MGHETFNDEAAGHLVDSSSLRCVVCDEAIWLDNTSSIICISAMF
jgi:hypothetical protein